MPAIHRLKTESRFFAAICRGDKTFEIRYNRDRDFQTGDTVIFEETPNIGTPQPPAQPSSPSVLTQPGNAPPPQRPATAEFECVITYVLHDTRYGIKDDFVIFGIRPV